MSRELFYRFLFSAVLFIYTHADTDTSTPKPKKILDTIMNPAYVPPEEKRGSYWNKLATTTIREKLEVKMNRNKAKNGILFIGDGMSLATVMAARTYAGQVQGGTGEETMLNFEKFPISGLAHTYCIDAQVPDSACTATSYLTGVKTKYGVIGLDGNVTRGSCYSQLHAGNWATSVAQLALDNGLDVGLVTTTRVTHASPAGMYAHVSERNWESDADVPDECLAMGCKDIAYQLINNDPGKRFKVIMGGGLKSFLVNDSSPLAASIGRRLDGVDLIDMWRDDKKAQNASYQFVTTREDLMKIYESDNLPEYLMGIYNTDHMAYHLKSNNEPTLAEMVEIAIKMLSRNQKGYFLFVEGGRIDHAHHDSLAHLALDETVEFSKAVKKATELTSPVDTLIVSSSDHAHTMTVAGYPSRGNDILGMVDTATGDDGLPYTTISYANGKAPSIAAGGRVDVSSQKDFIERSLDYSYPSLVPLDSETHGGEDVAVYASGPWQHLFTGSYEQNLVPHLMAYAMCIGEERHHHCSSSRGFHFLTSSSVIAQPNILFSIVSLLLILYLV